MKSCFFSLLHLAITFFAIGCYRVSGPSEIDDENDAGTYSDTDADTDSNKFSSWGVVELTDTVYVYNPNSRSVGLTAEFWEKERKPEDNDSFVGYFTAPDGTQCEIYFVSTLEPPEQPVQKNAGEIRAGPHGGGEYLSIIFEDGKYSEDVRYTLMTDPPFPDWMEETNPGFFFDGLGNNQFEEFSIDMIFSNYANFLSPTPTQPDLLPDINGDYEISWSIDGTVDFLTVVVHFNMDWDDSYFVCHPSNGANALIFDGDWVNDYSWGGGADILLEAVNEKHIIVRGTDVVGRALRVYVSQAVFN